MVANSRPYSVGGATIGSDLETTSLTSRYGERAAIEYNRRPVMTSTIDPADSELRYLSDWVEGLPERLDLSQPYREIGPAGHAIIMIQGEAVYVWDEITVGYVLGARLSTERPAGAHKCREITLEQLTKAQETAELRAEAGYSERLVYDFDERFDAVAELGLATARRPYEWDRDGLYPHQRDAVVEIRAEERHTYEAGLERIRPFPMRSLFGAGSLGAVLGMSFAGDGVFGRAPRRGKGAYDMDPWPATHSAVSEESERIVTSKAEAKRLRRADRNKKLAGGAA